MYYINIYIFLGLKLKTIKIEIVFILKILTV